MTVESRQERERNIVALKKELDSAAKALASFKSQFEEVSGVVGMEARAAKVLARIREQEKVLRVAGEQLALRLGVTKRPGRPKKDDLSAGQ